MKILHISNNDFSGAGLCAYRLHKSLQDMGIDSKMLVLRKTQNDDSIFHIFKIRYNLYRLFHLLMRKLGLYIYEYDKLIKLSIKYKVPFTKPITPFDLSNHPLVNDADIIHFHWIDDFFNQEKFLRKVRKNIIWTLHDEGMFYGISHYHDMILSDNNLEIKYRKIKYNMIKNAYKIHFVLLSEYFKLKFSNSEILKENTFSIIPNSVDCSKFSIYEKMEARSLLGLEDKLIYLSFIAGNIADSHKGLNILIEAVKLINKRIKILAIGGNNSFKGDTSVIETGTIRDSNLMSLYISASDYFVMPSLQEAFSQAPIEAMACGKPAIVTPVSGTKELINTNNGIICNGFSSYDIAEAIKQAMVKQYDSEIIRKDVITRFSPQLITTQYIDVYKKCLQ